MRLNEVRYGEGLPVEGYGPGFFRVGGAVHPAPLAVLPTGVIPWGGLEDAATLLAAAEAVDVLLVGMGAEIAHLPGALRAALEEAGLGVEVMSSPQACRTYNVLLGEGRRVGLAVLAV
jgi:uncharacterized protein